MSYFSNRPRAYSKPTKEETKELSSLLSKCSANDLRLVMLSAANESPDVANLFMKIMKDADLNPQSHLQPVQPNQQHTISTPCHSDTGLLTPIDISEDSEMSGTENVQPQVQQYSIRPEPFMPTPACLTFTNPPQHGSTSLKRSNKRKSLADRDDNLPSTIPTSSSSSQPSFLSKRRKPGNHHSETQSNPDKVHCLNCGLWTPNSKFENLHGCIYHPGDFNFDGTVCSWSCCRNSDLKSRGCLITRHKGLNKDAWLYQSDYTGDLTDEHGRTLEGHGHGQMSQYARIISIKG